MSGRVLFTVICLIHFIITSAQAQSAKDKPKYSPAEQLVLASFQLDVERVRTLLNAGINPDVRVRVSPSAIHPSFGNNPYQGNGFGIMWSFRKYSWTPLLAVAYSRRTPPSKNAKNIVTKMIDPQVFQERDKRRVVIATLLINQCAQLDLDDSFGTTPLNVALQNEYIPLSILLIKSGADPNIKPRHALDGEQTATPVHLATRNAEVLKLILKHGASLTVKDDTGHTPLDWAAYDYNVESVRILIIAGADVNARDANGVSPLYWVQNSKAIEDRDEPRKKIVKLFLDANAKE